MSESFNIEVKGLAELQRKVGEVAAAQWLQGTLVASAQDLMNWTAPYPPAPSYGGRNRWYERGYGPKWRLKSGVVHGYNTSQTMGRRWEVKSFGGLRAEIRNRATYSPYVHDREHQAKVHTARGWKTVQAMFEQHRGEIVQKLVNAVRALWQR